jgi:hypothetical protein
MVRIELTPADAVPVVGRAQPREHLVHSHVQPAEFEDDHLLRNIGHCNRARTPRTAGDGTSVSSAPAALRLVVTI